MTKFTQAERLMQEALAIIQGDRQQAYGPPDENFRRIGLLWTAYLQANGIDANLTPIMVCHLHDLAKLSRLIQTPDHEDTLRDRFGYAGVNVALAIPEQPIVLRSADGRTGSTHSYAVGGTTCTPDWTFWPPSSDSEEGFLRTPEAAE